jgi:hypothetical protein
VVGTAAAVLPVLGAAQHGQLGPQVNHLPVTPDKHGQVFILGRLPWSRGAQIKKAARSDGSTCYWFRVSAGRDATGKRIQVYRSG